MRLANSRITSRHNDHLQTKLSKHDKNHLNYIDFRAFYRNSCTGLSSISHIWPPTSQYTYRSKPYETVLSSLCVCVWGGIRFALAKMRKASTFTDHHLSCDHESQCYMSSLSLRVTFFVAKLYILYYPCVRMLHLF